MNSGKQISKYIFVLSFLLVVTASCPENKTADTLAVIGTTVITTENYIELYKDKLTKIGLTDNGETRRNYLQNLINDELMIQYAKSKNLHKSASAQNEYKRIYTQELLNAYSDKYISPEVNITESDLKDLYIKLNTKIKVSHLYASNKVEADSLYKLVMSGKSFNELAKDVFRDPVLKDNGGSLGYITVDEMDPEFERAAFAMNPGEISKPIKTVKGYSIIKVDDIKKNPLITENEFLKAYERLKTFARRRAYEQKTKEFAAKLVNHLGISFNEDVLNKLFRVVDQTEFELISKSENVLLKKYLNKNLLTYSKGSWLLSTLLEEMSIVPEKQLGWIRTKENLKDFITGLLNRRYIIDKAKSEKLDSFSNFNNKVEYAFNTYLLTTIEDQLKGNIKISPDSIQSYYNQNVHLFKSQPQIRLSSILLDSQESANTVSNKLLNDFPFEELAYEFSIQSIIAGKGGDIGYYKKEDLEYLGDELFTLKPGEWKGPFKDNGKYVFLKCTDFKPSSITPFEDCKTEIEEMMRSFKWYEMRERFTGSLQEEIGVTIFSEKLNTIKLK